jgi:hypothetical protein
MIINPGCHSYGLKFESRSNRKGLSFSIITLRKLSEVNGSRRSVVTLHDRKKILLTEERTGEGGRDDPELQNGYNLTFFKCSSTSWFMTYC